MHASSQLKSLSRVAQCAAAEMGRRPWSHTARPSSVIRPSPPLGASASERELQDTDRRLVRLQEE